MAFLYKSGMIAKLDEGERERIRADEALSLWVKKFERLGETENAGN